MKSLILVMVLSGFIFAACSSDLFACHYGSGYGSMYGNTGHFTEGLRGQKKNIHSLAKLLYRIDKDLVDNNIINANYFFGVAKKK